MPKITEGIDLVSELANQKADYACFTTYALDLAFFESKLFSQLQENNEAIKVAVLVDRKAYSEAALGGRYVRKAEAEYRLIPVDLPNGVFHPKIFFFSAKDWAKLYVGSANLTEPGVSKNLEIVDSIATAMKAPNCTNAFLKFSRFLADITPFVPENCRAGLEEFRKAAAPFGKGAQSDTLDFGSTLESSAYENFIVSLPPDISELILVSPFYDESIFSLFKIIDRFEKADVKIVVTRQESHFSMDQLPKRKNVGVYTFKSELLASRRLHAKVVYARNASQSFLLTGSMNLTVPGFMSQFPKGNIEAWISHKTTGNDLSHLFAQQYALKRVAKEIHYIQPAQKDKKKELALRILYANFADGDLFLSVDVAGLSGEYSVCCVLEGYLGEVKLTKDFKFVPNRYQQITFEISYAQQKQLRAACAVSLFITAPGFACSSNAVWVELSEILNEDPATRQLRAALEGAESLVYSQDPRQTRQGIRVLLRGLSELICNFNGAGSAANSNIGSSSKSPKSGEMSGYSAIPYADKEQPAAVGGVPHDLQLLSNFASVLSSIASTKAAVVQKAKGKPDDYSDDDERRKESESKDAEFPREIAAAISRDVLTVYEQILSALREYDPNEKNTPDVALKTIQILFELSFVINVVIAQNDKSMGADLQTAALNDYFKHCEKIFDLCFLERIDGEDLRTGWLRKFINRPIQPKVLPRYKRLVAILLVYISWGMTHRNRKSYREALRVVENLFGVNPEYINAEWEEIQHVISLHNQHCEIFNAHEIAKDIMIANLAVPTEVEQIKLQFEVIKKIRDCDRAIVSSKGNVNQNLLDERDAYIAYASKSSDRTVNELMGKYLQIVSRQGLEKEILRFVNRNIGACLQCHAAFPMSARNNLQHTQKPVFCDNCRGVIFVAVAEYFGE